MADVFIEPMIETDPDALVELGVARIQEDFPDWVPASGGITEATLGANAMITAEERDIATVVPRAIMRTIAVKLFKFFPDEATQATATVTITAKDNAGYTFEEGTQFTIEATGDESLGFAADEDIVIPPGSTTVTADLTALIPGAASSGLNGNVLPVLSFDWPLSVVLTAPTQGGQDAEDDDVFLNRFIRWVQTMAPRPILARDVPVFATRTDGVFRVYVLDNYNPADHTSTNEKMLAVFPVDEAGNNVSSGVKAALLADLLGNRESNFIWNIADPTRTNVKIDYKVKLLPGFDATTTLNAIDAAIMDYVSPATWGSTPEGEVPVWDTAQVTLRRAKLISIIQGVYGVDNIPVLSGNIAVLLAKGTAALAAADIDLDLPAPLPVVTALTRAVV